MTIQDKNTSVLPPASAVPTQSQRSASIPAKRFPAEDPVGTDLDPGVTSLAARQPRSPREQVLYVKMATDSWTRRDSFSLRHLCYLSEASSTNNRTASSQTNMTSEAKAKLSSYIKVFSRSDQCEFAQPGTPPASDSRLPRLSRRSSIKSPKATRARSK